MNLHLLRAPAPPALGQALEEFEAQFRYPLGPSASFSITHGRDYLTFFSAIGEAAVLVAEREGQVLATLASALRPLRLPSGEVKTVAYLADLKMDPAARRGLLLARLFGAMREHLQSPSGGMGYAVVMDGTRSTPLQYSGRLGFPSFNPVAPLTILCVTVPASPFESGEDGREIGEGEFAELHARLSPVGFLPLGGQPRIRSLQTPAALACGQGACGLVEDTHRGKRLLLAPGQEIQATHLSHLVWKAPADGAQIVRRALRYGHPGGTLFLGLPPQAAENLLPFLEDLAIQPAPATIFACGAALQQQSDWWVDSAEV